MIDTMTVMTSRAGDLDAVRAFAEYYGYTQIHDSGPCLDGKLAIFGDAEYAHDYLHGRGVRGKRIDVNFDRRGEVDYAHLTVDNTRIEEVARGQGSSGERLVWTAKLFIENPAEK
ncbi:hypothetical protein BVC93_31505 (plasmid) [Mycobacterium sp. MS1601]|nr:hypothetical protein BVC93_31505 [Mycobacterium sp. MS1601]